MHDDPEAAAKRIGTVLFPEEAGFDPLHQWSDLGRLIESMESSGYHLLLNSAAQPELRRMAAFHRDSDLGFPCAGSSEWGPFPKVAHAVILAADEALFRPRG